MAVSNNKYIPANAPNGVPMTPAGSSGEACILGKYFKSGQQEPANPTNPPNDECTQCE